MQLRVSILYITYDKSWLQPIGAKQGAQPATLALDVGVHTVLNRSICSST